jgi:hypothetical protein
MRAMRPEGIRRRRRSLGRPVKDFGPIDRGRARRPVVRKALLVVTLVAASFAGGAAVNGPGLKWAKGLLIGKMRQGDAIPTLEIDDQGPPIVQSDSTPAPVAEAKTANPPPSDVPSAPPPPLAESVLRASSAAKARPPEAPAEVATAAPAPITDPPADPAPPADSEPPPPLNSPADMPVLPGPSLLPAKEKDKESGWADAPGPAPATAVLPGSKARAPQTNDAQAMTASAPSPMSVAASADWVALRKRMKAIGVTRYWVEGTPGGPVVFRCLVPVGGDDSSGRQFEAEADDEARAAESALRRVALWQATEKIKN